jgi:hypothetical protein
MELIGCAVDDEVLAGRPQRRSTALVDYAILNDDSEVLLRIGDRVDVGQWVAFNEQQARARPSRSVRAFSL